jgi:hypothetical protein
MKNTVRQQIRQGRLEFCRNLARRAVGGFSQVDWAVAIVEGLE